MLVLAGAALGVPSAAAQAAQVCSGATPEAQAWCNELALAVQAAQGDMALLAAGGTEVAGTASTLGKRVGSSPRWSFGARLAGVGFEGPDLSRSTVASVGASGLGVSAQGSVAVGLFRGFSPTPTMGGVLAVDLLATGSVLWGPGALGYRGTDVGYGLGVRVGVFRESFTLPGITLSVAQRWIEGVGISGGNVSSTGDAVDLGVSTTSLRGEIGKDLWGLGWLGGVGWDRSGSDGTVTTLDGTRATFSGVSDHRTLWFVGASWSYFVVQLSAEAGWASGWGAGGPPRPDEAYDPETGRFYGGLAARFIY